MPQNTPQPTPSNNNLIPHWSYEKSSLAAAYTFTALAILALLFLTFLTIRKIRLSWQRHKLEHHDYSAFSHRIDPRSSATDDRDLAPCFMTESNKSSRESLMYSHENAPCVGLGYVVEQTGGEVTRVFREGNNVSTQTFESI
ncbi:hypothetical protein BBP40_009969, partial [Aspergillus hancockii]